MIAAPIPPSRLYKSKIADPARWNAFKPRAGDVVVTTPPKSGTTWMQGIVALLVSGDPLVDADLDAKAPWLDINEPDIDTVMHQLESQENQRQIKTHTPLDGIPIWPDLRYICVFRHPIDVHFSFRNHLANMTKAVLGDIYPDDPSESFAIFLNGTHRDGASLASIIDHYNSALACRDHENVLCLHYADMLRDLPTAVRRISTHIKVAHPPDVEQTLIDAATFDNMKSNADRFVISAGKHFWKQDSGFFESASSNKWLGKLTQSDLDAYDKAMNGSLNADDRHWLEWGSG